MIILKEQYLILEDKVFSKLKDMIDVSPYISVFVKEKALQITECGFKELTFINDKLVFIDDDGLHYDVFYNCRLKDLINIIYNR